MSLKKKTLWGILWTGVGKMGMQAIQVLVTAVLARVLDKSDYGLANLATLVTSAIIIVNETGLGTAIVMQKEIEKRQLSSVFWGSIGFGSLLFLAFASASPAIARLLKIPAVQPILMVQALGFVIGSFGVVPRALLAKSMHFKQLSMIELSAAALSGLAAISLAFAGLGPWSIIAGVLLRDTAIVVMVWMVSRWRPLYHFVWREFRAVFGFSAQVLANDVALYLNTNSDITIVSRYMGAAAVASYGNLLNLVKLPVSRLSQIVSKVAFPAFASVQDDLALFRRGYVQAIAGISSLTFPMLIGLAIFSREVVTLLFSSKYEDMVQPLIILVPYAMLKSVVTIKGSVLIARRRPGIELAWNVAYMLPFAVAIYYGARYGLVGVACAFTGLYLLTFPIIQSITNRQVNLTNRDFVMALWPAFASALFMLAVGIVFRHIISLFGPMPMLVTLITGVPLLGACYLLFLGIVFRRQSQELRSLWSLVKKSGRNSETGLESDTI